MLDKARRQLQNRLPGQHASKLKVGAAEGGDAGQGLGNRLGPGPALFEV
jgi:hypothetical protein